MSRYPRRWLRFCTIDRVDTASIAQEGERDLEETPLGRVFRIIEGVVVADGSVGPRELARQIGIDRSTVGRALLRLASMGVLERDGRSYRPGPRLLAISRSLTVRDSLSNAANSALRELSTKFDESTYLCLRQGSYGVFVYDYPTTNPVRYVLELGKPFPLYVGATGRAILAGLPAEEAAQVIDSFSMEPFTSRTITDRDELLRVIEADHAVGYSASVSERFEGGSGIAAPFYDASGLCLGAVVLTCPASRLNLERVPEMGAAVEAAALALSVALGHRRHQVVATFEQAAD